MHNIQLIRVIYTFMSAQIEIQFNIFQQNQNHFINDDKHI